MWQKKTSQYLLYITNILLPAYRAWWGNAYSSISVGKPQENRLLGRSKHSWQNDINPYPQENMRIWTGFVLLIKRGKW
jgi:hypothetical protein